MKFKKGDKIVVTTAEWDNYSGEPKQSGKLGEIIDEDYGGGRFQLKARLEDGRELLYSNDDIELASKLHKVLS